MITGTRDADGGDAAEPDDHGEGRRGVDGDELHGRQDADVLGGDDARPSPVTAPTVSSKTGAAVAFGTATTITFTNGVATVSGANNGVLTLYRAETARGGGDRRDDQRGGGGSADGDGERGGAQQVCGGADDAAERAGSAFSGTNTLTAQDAFGNTVTSFNAATNNVTLAGTGALSGGTISGLSGGNTLTSAGDFSAGVANLTTLGLTYTGASGTGTFTATATGGDGHVGERDGQRRARRRGWCISGTATQTAGTRAEPDDHGEGWRWGDGRRATRATRR